MAKSIIFDGSLGFDDNAYRAWLNNHLDGFVANIPHPNEDFNGFSVVIHHANCYQAKNDNGGSLTSNTQLKACNESQSLVEQDAKQYTKKPFRYCGTCFKHSTP